MKLAIVSQYPPEISGIGQYGARLSTALARHPAIREVHVFANQSPGAPQIEQREDLVIERVWRRQGGLAVAAVTAALRRWRPDVVWFNVGLTMFGQTRLSNFAGLAAPMLTCLQGIPAIVTLHEIFEMANLRSLGAVNGRITGLGGRAATKLLLQTDAVCLTLQSYVREIRARYRADNVVHVPLGVFDTPHFTPLPAEKRVLIFTTYAPYKGLPELIDIFRELQTREASLKLTVAGSDHPRFPGYLASVRATVGDLPGLEWRVGVPESEVPALFASACVVALPCRATTGASSVAHRAATHGRPFVAYGLPDLHAVAEEEGLVLDLVSPGDRRAFTARLRSLLDDPQQCERIGRTNIEAMKAMTLEVTCQRYVQLFEKAMSRSRHLFAAGASAR